MNHAPSSEKLPRHVAIIMDGNGRWAMRRNLPRTAGHKQGVEATRRVVQAAAELGIQYLTLFGFSSENWKRPEPEIRDLMGLLRYYLRAETAELHKSGVRLRIIGNRQAFESDIVELIENAEKLTADNTQINLVIALNYGGRQDILHATKRLIDQSRDENLSMTVQELENIFAANMMTAGIPDPDLLIRTSGEKRVSNFLLWQCAYSEMVFSETLWPDFGKPELQQALGEYAGRDRRFGAISSRGSQEA
ncbi:MAG: isoprenyl transferase [Alphaproteobacteria bacterium]